MNIPSSQLNTQSLIHRSWSEPLRRLSRCRGLSRSSVIQICYYHYQ